MISDIANALVDNYLNQSGLLSESQIPEDIYNRWIRAIRSLYKCSIECLRNEEWNSMADLIQQQGNLQLHIKELIDCIGIVNGFLLKRDYNLGILIIAYASSHRTQNQSHENLKTKDLFRLRIENCFARMIIEQQNKSAQVLNDETEDLRLIRKMKRKRMRQKAAHEKEKPVEPVLEPPTPPTVPQTKEIGFEAFVVHGNISKCNKNHAIEDIRAIVELLTPAGSVYKETVSAGYCKDCDVYFLLEHDYKRLRQQGVLLCQLVERTTYQHGSSVIFGGVELKPESILHQSGYNVSSSDGLTDIQRHEILKRVIDAGLTSNSGLMAFFDGLIKKSEKSSKKNMSSAIEKWRADRTFVANYNKINTRAVPAGKII